MDRTFLRRAAAGDRVAGGAPVLTLQRALAAKGFPPGPIDGAFGSGTAAAVRGFQAASGIAATGRVDAATWRTLVGTAEPELFARCLALTAAFEGHGYGLAIGNFDGALLTWGIIGFTLGGGGLTRVLLRIEEHNPGLIAAAVGAAKADELARLVVAGPVDRRAWANRISIPPARRSLRDGWGEALAALGARPEVEAVQEGVAREVYWARALRDARRLELEGELGLALCFDTAVQNGGIDRDTEALARARIMRRPHATPLERRMAVADAVADRSAARWREDVRARRRTIATGRGMVHGSRYTLEDWGLIDTTSLVQAALAA